jgi:imidazolonepropionase-like amidohydrolase
MAVDDAVPGRLARWISAAEPELAGTDAMGLPMIIPGSSLLRELHLLNQSGLTPYEAIRSATVSPANFLGKEKDFGAIAVGKRADLLLLDRNPLETVSALNQPVGVMVRGRWLPRERLQEILSALR